MAACQGDVICNREVLYCIILQKPKFLHAFRSLIRQRYICTLLAVDVHNNVIFYGNCFLFQFSVHFLLAFVQVVCTLLPIQNKIL